MHSSIPKGATLITEEELTSLLLNNIDKNTIREELEKNIYDLILPILKSKRLYFPNLNKNILIRILRGVYDRKKVEVFDEHKALDVYSDLSWKKINYLPYDENLYLTIQKELHGRGLLTPDS